MTRKDKARLAMFIGVVQFIADYLGDLKTGVIAAQKAILTTVVERLDQLAGEQSDKLSESRYTYHSKGSARENLREIMSEIANTAHSMSYKFPGVDLKFRLVNGSNDAEMLARARAFQSEATVREADFIEFEMKSDFLTTLDQLIEDFAESLAPTTAARTAHVEATAEIGEEIRKGMIAVRTMTGAITNRFKNDTGKQAAWLTASHVEKVPVSSPRTVKPEEIK